MCKNIYLIHNMHVSELEMPYVCMSLFCHMCVCAGWGPLCSVYSDGVIQLLTFSRGCYCWITVLFLNTPQTLQGAVIRAHSLGNCPAVWPTGHELLSMTSKLPLLAKTSIWACCCWSSCVDLDIRGKTSHLKKHPYPNYVYLYLCWCSFVIYLCP